MNIIGNGVDIVDNTRIKNAIKNKFFVSRIFTVNEIKKSKNLNNKANYFAKRFAAKEAFVKALGEGFRNNINFSDYLEDNEEGIHICDLSENKVIEEKVCETNNIIEDNFCLMDDINYHSNNIKNELLENKIQVLNSINCTFKKLGQSVEYYKYYLNDIKQLKFFDDNILSMINSNNSNLYNMILIQKNNIDELENLKYKIGRAHV